MPPSRLSLARLFFFHLHLIPDFSCSLKLVFGERVPSDPIVMRDAFCPEIAD